MKIFKATIGLAREEIILGTVVVGGIGALGSIAINASGIFASSSQAALHIIEDLESANLKFFKQYGYWPHQVTDGTATANVAVLQNRQFATKVRLDTTRGNQPMLDAALKTANGQAQVLHTAGEGGVVKQIAMGPDSNFRYTIILDHLSPEDARQLDEKLDGKQDPRHGRLTINYTGNRAIVSYKSNPKTTATASIKY
jgi:hypothetical protein